MNSEEIPAEEAREQNPKSDGGLKETIKEYILKSKVTSVAICLGLVMFLISVVMSWTYSV